MTTDSRDRAAPPFHHDFEDWWGMLDGKPSCIPASRVSLGFYAQRDIVSGSHVGVAIWLGSDSRPWVKLGSRAAFSLSTDEAEAQFSVEHLAWMMAVTEEAYRAWAATGAWPDGTVLDRPRPKVERVKPAAADAEPAEKQPAVYVRLYRTIDPPKSSMTFMARAIARTKSGAEGFSVGFYADTEAGARKMAEIWIAEERAKADRAEAARQSRAERMRRPTAQSDQPVTEGASA